VPCTETAPLDLTCPDNVKCEEMVSRNGLKVRITISFLMPNTYVEAENKGDKEPEVKCSTTEFTLYHLEGTDWNKVTELKCNKLGKWNVKMKPDGPTKELGKGARIVCANASIIPTTTPPP
ncbi:hypothetical protein PMAYCL1PPCAC_19427, partial [Pristionchus mayeri]